MVSCRKCSLPQLTSSSSSAASSMKMLRLRLAAFAGRLRPLGRLPTLAPPLCGASSSSDSASPASSACSQGAPTRSVMAEVSAPGGFQRHEVHAVHRHKVRVRYGDRHRVDSAADRHAALSAEQSASKVQS